MIGALLGIGMQVLPGIMGALAPKGQVNQRSILNLQNMKTEINAMRQTTAMMQQSRQAIGTARALLSSSGFSGSIGSMAETIPGESAANLGADVGLANLSRDIAKMTREMSVSLSEMGAKNKMGPLESKLFETVGQPLMSSAFKNLGTLIGAF